MTQQWFALRPELPPGLLIVLLLAAGSFVLWLEARRKHRFRTLRIIAAACLVLMLSAILLRPHYAKDRSPSILLLTPGFNPTAADSLIKANPAITLLRTPGTLPYKKAPLLTSWQTLAHIGGDIRYITGQGLPQHALDVLNNHTYTFLPAAPPQGIVQLTLPPRITANRSQILHGIMSLPGKGTQLILKGPGGNEDSISIGQKPLQPFALTIHPKQAGNFLYTLRVRDSAGYQTEQHIPITVQPQKRYNVLFLQRYPNFETQYLKRFLAKEHALVLRSQLSRNAYRYEYANHAVQNTDRLTSDVLNTFDLVILDSDVLHTLPASEFQALQKAIAQQGLGILILLNDAPANINHFKTLLPISFTGVTTDTVRFTSPATTRSVVLPAWPVRTTANASITPVTKSKGTTLAGYRYNSLGKVAFQLLQETYRLTLEGDSLTYAALWTPLLEETARTETKKNEIHLPTPFPYYPDQPIAINIITTTTPKVTADSIPLPLTEDLTIDDLFHTTTWASTPGWHAITIPADSTLLNYYVSPPTEWTALAAIQATNNTHAKALTSKSDEIIIEPELVPISPFIFYLLLILAAAFLWIAPKL